MAAAPVGLLRSLAGRAIAHPPRQSPPPAGLLRPLGLLRSLAASREAASLTGVSVSDFSGRGQRAKRAHRAYGRHRRARARKNGQHRGVDTLGAVACAKPADATASPSLRTGVPKRVDSFR